MAKIDEYMAALSKEAGLDIPFKPLLPGVYMFSIDEDVTVSVTDKNGTIVLNASFGPIPGKQEVFYTDLLCADLFYQGTERAVLGVQRADNKVIIKKVIDREVNEKEFSEEIEDFLNTIEVWRERAIEFR